MSWDSEPRPEDPSGLGCSQQDFETMRAGAVLDLFSVELRISICSLLAEIQKINAGQFIYFAVHLAIRPMRRVPILADLAQISDLFITTGLKRPETQDPRPYFCDCCILPLHLSKYRVGSALSGQVSFSCAVTCISIRELR
jgi:hypothetical protein